jgi:metal-responsive CopG/Arc/MetJ family transcriptional regulator
MTMNADRYSISLPAGLLQDVSEATGLDSPSAVIQTALSALLETLEDDLTRLPIDISHTG